MHLFGQGISTPRFPSILNLLASWDWGLFFNKSLNNRMVAELHFSWQPTASKLTRTWKPKSANRTKARRIDEARGLPVAPDVWRSLEGMSFAGHLYAIYCFQLMLSIRMQREDMETTQFSLRDDPLRWPFLGEQLTRHTWHWRLLQVVAVSLLPGHLSW